MVNRADINSVLLQMRQVRQQMQATDPTASTAMTNPAQVANSNQVGAPKNSFAAQLEQQTMQQNLQQLQQASSQQPRAELTQQDLINQANALTSRPGNQMDLTPSPSTPSIGEMMGNAINHVNETQMHAGSLSTRYTQGDPNVDLPEVMVAMQKSSVSFQAMSQVRNKLLEAYKDIMNMPV